MSIDDQPLTLGDFKRLMAEHEENEFEQQNAMLKKCMSGFPKEDPVAHCEYHQRKLDAAKAEQEFWEAAKLKLVEHGITGVFRAIWIVLALALFGLSIKLGVKFPFPSGWGL